MPERVNFGKLKDVLEIPDLIGVQLDSYRSFLQMEVPQEKRQNQGIQEIFNEVFPIESFDKQIRLEFVSYTIGTPKKGIVDCIKDGDSYQASLNAEFKLDNKGTITTESVQLGEIPLMTPRGSFVINGAERVIISQLHRSPGICFEKTRHSSGKTLYSFRIIPDRGSWMEVQFDINNLIYIYLDRRRRRRKFLITTFLRAIGYDTDRDILSAAYELRKMTPSQLLKEEDMGAFYTLEPIYDANGDVVIDKPFVQLNETLVKALSDAKIKGVEYVYAPNNNNYLLNCLEKDPAKTPDDALKEIYRRMRPGDPPSIPNARQLLKRLFFDNKRYDLGLVGRFKLNERLGVNIDPKERILYREDLMEATKMLMKLCNTGGQTDDIDHLGARRVRPVGELLQNHCRVGLLRTERLIRERMSLMNSDDTTMTPDKLINPKAFSGVIRDFFSRNQLSQFMDQTNPLSELTNKRRLSALGPGGLSRDRAGFEVRDVHPSHYGRICPIETPEGPNIGLISSMSLYSRINHFGFLETPYRRVENGIVTDQIDYLSADKEELYVIAQANAPLNEDHSFRNPTVMCRYKGESAEHPREEVGYMDVSPKQLVSAAAGLIPFLEHDDANRALMGSNMQRQAVPLLVTDAPYVGTGMERKVAFDSRAVVAAEADGIVAEVSSDLIVTTVDGLPRAETTDPNPKVYELVKFLRSNAGTAVNQRPLVRSGETVKIGDPIADGAATENGELALGKNVFVAYMPWCGYNFEDAIVLSERLVKEDVYTSIHVDEFEINSRDTKLGPEEITSDIPNLGEEALRNIGVDGVVRLGAEVKPGDILVGKITPKSETELAPEERLLRAIFGEKAADVKDSSLTVPSGKGGIVMDVRIEYAKDPNRQALTKSELKRQLKQAKEEYKQQFAALQEELVEELSEKLLGQKITVPVYDTASGENVVLISQNRKVTRPAITKLAAAYATYSLPECPMKSVIDSIMISYKPRFMQLEQTREERIASCEQGNAEDTGVIKKVKVYVASKRKIQVGDKMAGRHGNKGIVSRIVAVEDMPFLKDGRPVDIVLNPLGVPSRMNIGQVLETHLGWAASMLGMKVATPVFDGIDEHKIVDLMAQGNARVCEEKGEDFHWGFKEVDGEWVFDGKTDLYDGRTGNKFDQRVTVGQVYMLKLDHLVANKIHARSVGPYSLVTQQPLGGKAQHGGQRFGEMEVWALEAYGAAHTLQEMLTVKSDDVTGRARIYESIVQGKDVLEPGRPESFNVLLKEMQSLALDVRTVKRTELPKE
ncbi:MAG: DNA-directed RNA polymerase subunit beta [Lentisphaeria bacterium]|nr:DNA-directed RNA polymerase subunit beta [Lentisphaeria bacterium]